VVLVGEFSHVGTGRSGTIINAAAIIIRRGKAVLSFLLCCPAHADLGYHLMRLVWSRVRFYRLIPVLVFATTLLSEAKLFGPLVPIGQDFLSHSALRDRWFSDSPWRGDI